MYDTLQAEITIFSYAESDIINNHHFSEVENNNAYNATKMKVFFHGKIKYDPIIIDGKIEENNTKITMDTSKNKINDSEPEKEEEIKGRKKSMIHNDVKNGKLIFISFDIETDGDDYVMLQLSV